MSNVTRIKAAQAHSLQGMREHLSHDNPVGGTLITRSNDGGWEWRFYGEPTVVELTGAMEMVKHDLLTKDREMSDE